MTTSRFSFASGTNAGYIEEMYEKFRQDPASVEEGWRKFFEGYEFAITSGGGSSGSPEEGHENAKVEAYINAYRRLGHLSAHLNPLAAKPPIRPDMSAEYHGLGNIDRTKKFYPANLPTKEGLTLGEIETLLQDTYCSFIGPEFRESDDIEFVKWIQDQMESCRNKPTFSKDVKLRILDKLVAAEGFETFLQARYLGQKRFSIEGADSFMCLMDQILHDSGANGVEELCVGMAHRGRLNMLANFMGKSFELMLKEFEGIDYNPFQIDGDVKYHMGFASEVPTASGNKMRLYLSPNPSHLEAVDPVVTGFSYARQHLIDDNAKTRVMPILIHGDASFMGQGLVAETLNLSELKHYTTGGTIHVIINNQVGFTTFPEDSRSCTYASGLAKMIKAPVLHVNADHPEAVIWCAQLAVAYRQRFHKDIVIDLIGYRRYGHNETDEPSFTQPLMYKAIAKLPTVLTQYSEKLIKEGIVQEEEVRAKSAAFRDRLQSAFEFVRSGAKDPEKLKFVPPKPFSEAFAIKPVNEGQIEAAVETGVSLKKLKDLGKKITTTPSGFTPHPKVVRLLEQRGKMTSGEAALDWPFAELLAFSSLAADGHVVRLSGQDCQRGTFSSRHSVLKDFNTGEPLELLNQLGSDQGKVEIINSPLSEQGVMGFEFGYSIANRQGLVLWEGQFGDFVNGAQIIIDQFLVASEAKWKQSSGLVLLLPHGYEGMGPEHSSARPERFLQLCGNLNIQVAIPTTPAQYFHILRRQLVRDFRKPLIIMSPKSLLRHPKCVSPMAELEKSRFHEVLADERIKDPKSVKRVVLCSGKIYYELTEATALNPEEVAIVRLEQLYPFPAKALKEVISKYSKAKELVWTQEEPQNMGAWTFVRPRLLDIIDGPMSLKYIGRRESGTTAEGSSKAHAAEQARIINEALNPSVTSTLSQGKTAAAGR